MPYRYVIKGTGFYSKSPDSFAVLENHLFCVDNDGTLATCITPGTAFTHRSGRKRARLSTQNCPSG